MDTSGLGRFAEPAVLILSSLAGGDKHGYALVKDIEQFASVRLGPVPSTARSPGWRSAVSSSRSTATTAGARTGSPRPERPRCPRTSTRPGPSSTPG
jgi:hypothetical protein